MNTFTATRVAVAGVLLLALAALGCDPELPSNKTRPAQAAPKREPASKKVQIGKNVFLEIQGDKRRVHINASVCARKLDQLEQFLCRKSTKEHEAIVAADMDARHIHAALIAAKAEPGSPVQFRPVYKAATGTKIKVLLQYQQNGQTVTVPAQRWIKNIKTGKEMEYDWVFAGSRFYPAPEPGMPPEYAANVGDVICVSNFETAMLDLPVNLPNSNEALEFLPFTERIPEMGTPVTIILEPVLKK